MTRSIRKSGQKRQSDASILKNVFPTMDQFIWYILEKRKVRVKVGFVRMSHYDVLFL